jgi:hypothetical protein
MPIFSAIKYVSILIIVGVFAGGLYYVSDLKAAFKISEENSKKLETVVNDQKNLINIKSLEIEKIQFINSELSESNDKLKEEINKLNEKFNISANGQSRDFGAITRAKPALINKIINRATEKVNRCFEIATGSPLKEGEKNDECQELINNLSK